MHENLTPPPISKNRAYPSVRTLTDGEPAPGHFYFPRTATKMMDIHKSTDANIRALLDSTQQKKWDEMQAKREQWGQNRRHGSPDGDQQGPPPQQ